MSHRPALSQVARGARSFVTAALVLVQPVVSALLLVPSQPAHADVASGDVVFIQNSGYTAQIKKRSSTGTVTSLTPINYTVGGNSSALDVSRDGSRIVFYDPRPCVEDASQHRTVILTVNSDGSGENPLTSPDCPQNESIEDSAPRWSPDGKQVAFAHTDNITTLPGEFSTVVYKVDAATTVETALTTTGTEYDQPSWSPADSSGNYRIVYDTVNTSTGQYELYIMDEDGSNKTLLTDSTYGASGNTELRPLWSHDGSRIYFLSSGGIFGNFWYYESTDGFATADHISRHQITGAVNPGQDYDLSKDDSTLVFPAPPDGSPYTAPVLMTMSVSGGDPTPLSNTTNFYMPSFVDNAWPPTYCNTSTICISTPSPSDAPYTRQVTVGLSSSGVKEFQYCWSTVSSGSDPGSTCSSHVQTTTDLTTKKGTLNYLGVYSGSGTTWYDGTQPNSDYYLWVRSVPTSGSPNAWNGGGSNKPLFVHTPRRPVWVGLGDSYSSGHHQDGDEPICPTTEDAEGIYADVLETGCIIEGAPHLTRNDLTYSWVKLAKDSLNDALHAPTAWVYPLDLEALSGAWTSAFGASGTTPGTDEWASGTAQSAAVRSDLYAGYDSWNVVSMTGGANDAGLEDTLSGYYHSHFGTTAPWAVTTSNPATDCPDSQAIWNNLTATQLDNRTLDQHIQDNLQGVASVATRFSPGVRVLNVGYPYVVDHSNSCSADSGSWHGSKSVVDHLNADHTAVTGANVRYIDLTSSGGFGQDPVTGGPAGTYLQLDRLYGYPHPVDVGQARIASLAGSTLIGAGWGGTDYVTNGSFESGSAGGWHNDTTNATPSVTTAQAHSGSYSMTFTGSFNITDSPNFITTQLVDIDPADFWVKGPAGKTIQAYFRQYLTDGTNSLYQSFTLTGGWDHIVTKALHLYGPNAPNYDPTKPGVDFSINNPGAGSSDVFYIDDVHEYGYVAAETCGFQNLMSSLNNDAVENCGGEDPYGTQGWAANDSNVTVTSDTADAHDGLSSFKLVANANATITMNDSSDWRGAGEVDSGATSCTATAWMKGPNLSGRTLKLRIREYKGSTFQGDATATATPNGSWQQLTVTRTLASGHDSTTHLDLNPYMTGAQTNDVVRVDHITETCQ